MLPESQLEENGLALLTLLKLKLKQFTLAEDLILILAIGYCVCFSIQQKSMIFQADQRSNMALCLEGSSRAESRQYNFNVLCETQCQGETKTPCYLPCKTPRLPPQHQQLRHLSYQHSWQVPR